MKKEARKRKGEKNRRDGDCLVVTRFPGLIPHFSFLLTPSFFLFPFFLPKIDARPV